MTTVTLRYFNDLEELFSVCRMSALMLRLLRSNKSLSCLSDVEMGSLIFDTSQLRRKFLRMREEVETTSSVLLVWNYDLP
jgi:hypothetical protein